MLLTLWAAPAFATIGIVNLTAEVTWTLGARVPMGLAMGVEGGAFVGVVVGGDLLAFAELNLPAGQPIQLSLGARIGPSVQAGYNGYASQVSAHGELGWSFRLGAWSGLRVGGDLRALWFRSRYSAMVDVRAKPYDPNAPLPLPRLGIDPLNAHTLGFGVAILPYDAW